MTHAIFTATSRLKNCCFVLLFLQPSKADFHSGFDVVFVDPSGYLNLCAGMTAAQYRRVSVLCCINHYRTQICNQPIGSVVYCPWHIRIFSCQKRKEVILLSSRIVLFTIISLINSQLQHEARLSLEFLDSSLFMDSFEVLFMKPVPFTQTFDQFLQ